jgi:hypothetical protein
MKRFTALEAKQLIGKKVRWVDVDNPDKEWFEATVHKVDPFFWKIYFVSDPSPRDLEHIKMELVE